MEMRRRASAQAWTKSGTPPVSRPSKSVSSRAKAKSVCAPVAWVVRSTRRPAPAPAPGPPGVRAARKSFQERWLRKLGMLEIIEGGAPERALGEGKAAGLDDVDGHVEAGAEPQKRAGVGRNVGLEERQAHRRKVQKTLSREPLVRHRAARPWGPESLSYRPHYRPFRLRFGRAGAVRLRAVQPQQGRVAGYARPASGE